MCTRCRFRVFLHQPGENDINYKDEEFRFCPEIDEFYMLVLVEKLQDV